MATYAQMEALLAGAARQLDEAAAMIKALDMNPVRNVRTIGEVIVEISLLRNQIYARHPELKPAYLKSAP